MKQFDITVKIRIDVSDADPGVQYNEALFVANHYAEMAMKYKSVGAVKIIEAKAEELNRDKL